jgi:HEAT repeat protein
MSKPFLTIAGTFAVAAAAAVAVAAQHRIANGRVTEQPGGSLQQAFEKTLASRSDVAWLGYAVPSVGGDRTMCCVNDGRTRVNGLVVSDGACCGACGLEPGGGGAAPAAPAAAPQAGTPIKLEGPDTLVVLVRIVNRQVERVRVFSEDCQLDAGGREVVWLTGVEPAQSIRLLESLVRADTGRRDRVSDGAIMAIALHRGPDADAGLERLVAPAQPDAVRAKVPLWLGIARGARGLALLQRLVAQDPSVEVRKKAVFGLSQSREAGATDLLLEQARAAADAAVRGEAVFWLAQRAGEKAAAAIADRIQNDPETDVKKRAVFALSQLPKSEGVPLLIQVARTHSNPAVRKQAIFWLGQSRDPKALDFFAEILK